MCVLESLVIHITGAPHVISWDSHSSSPLTLARIYHFLALVITASSLSSSLRSPFRHLPALSLVISQLWRSSSPSSEARHLPRDNDWGAGENISEPLRWMQVSTRSVCLPPKSYLLIPTHHSSNDLFSSDSPFRILLLCNTSIAHLSRLQFLPLITNCAQTSLRNAGAPSLLYLSSLFGESK